MYKQAHAACCPTPHGGNVVPPCRSGNWLNSCAIKPGSIGLLSLLLFFVLFEVYQHRGQSETSQDCFSACSARTAAFRHSCFMKHQDLVM